MSSDEEEVKLYSALDRNQNRRQIFVSLSSSESEDDEVFEARVSFTSPPRKRARRGSGSIGSAASPIVSKATSVPNDGVVVLDDDDEDDMMTATEREREKRRALELEAEIKRRLAQDTVLNQSRAVINLTTSTKRQLSAAEANASMISLDSDDEVLEVKRVQPILPPPSIPAPADKGERLTLQVRSNGSKVDEIVIFSNEPFSSLYQRFCELHGLPRSAVQMSLDGEKIREQDTPQSSDLESGDLIDAKVDFTKAGSGTKRTVVRLRLIVDGRKAEVFRIDVTSTMEKLHSSFCKKHRIAEPDDVEMTVKGQPIRMNETIDDHQLSDDDEIYVTLNNFVDPSTIQLNLRYDAKTSQIYSVVPNHRVESLITIAARHLRVDTNRISLRLDGEGMQPHQTFEYYDLEGGELIEVQLRP